jgi:hypothetical protein
MGLANDSDIEEENLASFDVNVTVKTAEATKMQGARGLTPARLPVLEMITGL